MTDNLKFETNKKLMLRLKQVFAGHPAAAWMVLVLSLMVTSWAWYISNHAVSQSIQERFQFEAEDVSAAIVDRMTEYELALRSGRALFNASSEVTRQEWTRFTDDIQLQKYFPGVQALGYSVMLTPDELQEHEASVRAEGFDDYQVKPEGERAQYSAIKYISPFNWRNQRAFGYDMYSEPTRREAMQRARDTGEPAASGRVTLVQETSEDTQFGFLMYFPVYQDGLPPEDVEDRRRALTSFVYAAFRMRDLMYGILGQAQKDIDFQLFDSTWLDPDAMLYNSAKSLQRVEVADEDRFYNTTTLNVAGRPWTLHVYSQPGFVPFSQKHQPTFIVIVGVLLDIFLFYLISHLVRGRNQAHETALLAKTGQIQSQKRLQLAAEAGGLGLAEWKIADNRLIWDDTMMALYGYTPETFKGELSDWTQRVHPDDLEQASEVIQRARDFQNRFEMEFRIILPDGQLRYIAANVIVERDNADQAVRMVGFNRDITEQRMAEKALNEKNWRMQNVLEGTNAGSWEWNIETGETVFNNRWAEMMGYRLDELEPLSTVTWFDRIHPDDRAKTDAALEQHFAGAVEFYQCQYRVQHRAGHWIWVMDRGRVFTRSRDNKALLMFGTRHDISEQKMQEEKLRQERDKAELANRSRGEFLANMSHEIRTPINGVIGSLNLLNDKELSPTQQNLINISKRSAHSLLALINDILDLSKIESGKLKIHPAEFELVSVINEVARGLASRAETKGLALLCPDHHMPPLRVVADSQRLRQVLNNLLNNAIKFTDKGQITLDIENLEDKASHIKLRFNIRDTGQGISADKQENLFHRFEQVDNSMTRREGGTGLGLAICKQLIRLMGGEIGVESEPGKGSRFWFQLDFDRAERKDDSDYQPPFTEMAAFVVNADPLYQDFYQSVFAVWQLDYHSAVDCQQAMQKIKEVSPVHPVMIIDARSLLDDRDLAAYLNDCRQRMPYLRLMVMCPQSMLAIIPQQVSDIADLIVSKPVVQSELYNALLSVVEGDIIDAQPEPRKDAELQRFEARVLVVEDNPTNVIIIKGLLTKFGIDCEVADNGKQALERVSAESFDLVLMDCQMPVMDGYEATRCIRNISDIPVVALTAHAMREDEQKCLDAGMNDYLSKPIDPYRLNQTLAHWLPAQCQAEPVS